MPGTHPYTGRPQAHLLASTSYPSYSLALALCPDSSHRALTGNRDQVSTLPTPTLIPGTIFGDLRAEPCLAFVDPLTD